MILLNIYYRVQGEHVHCRVLVGPHLQALAHAGNLVLRANEFLALYRGQFNAQFFEEEEDRNV
jgi:hypothetical protein